MLFGRRWRTWKERFFRLALPVRPDAAPIGRASRRPHLFSRSIERHLNSPNGISRDMQQDKSPVRIPAQIAADLGAKIVSGGLKAGTILDGEVEASGQRQVSRSAYREAVRILRAKGLVESRPKIG